jgi:hypothetical protein
MGSSNSCTYRYAYCFAYKVAHGDSICHSDCATHCDTYGIALCDSYLHHLH